jgi:hypothetical protein
MHCQVQQPALVMVATVAHACHPTGIALGMSLTDAAVWFASLDLSQGQPDPAQNTVCYPMKLTEAVKVSGVLSHLQVPWTAIVECRSQLTRCSVVLPYSCGAVA